MPVVADKVVVELEARISNLEAGLKGAEAATARTSRNMKMDLDRAEAAGLKMGQGIKQGFSMVKTAAAALAGAAIVQQFFQMAKAGLDYASSLQEVAQQVGVTSDTLQEFRYIATQVGLSAEEMDGSLAMFNRRLGQAATGNDKMIASFDKLGINFRDAQGGIRETGDLIAEAADKISAMEDPALQAAAAVELFGRSGMKMLPALLQGSAGMNQLRQAAHALGIVISKELIAKADDAADKVAQLNLVLKANIAGAVAQNANAILVLVNALVKLVSWAGAAVVAFQKVILMKGQAIATMDSYRPFAGSAARQRSADLAERYRVERARLDPSNIDQKGGFRDYGLAPIPGFKPGAPSIPGMTGANMDPTIKAGGGGGGAGGGAGAAGKSVKEINQEYVEQIRSIMERYTQTRLSMAMSAEEQAELEHRLVEIARIRAETEIKNNTDFNAAQKKVLMERLAQAVEEDRVRVDFEKERRLAEERVEFAQKEADIRRVELQSHVDSATTLKQRREAELAMLAFEQEIRRIALDELIARKDIAEAVRKRAELERDNLGSIETRERGEVDRRTEGPLKRRAREGVDFETRAEELVLDEVDRLRESMADTLADQIGIENPLIKSLLNLLLEKFVFQPIIEALSKANSSSSGGGGILGGIVSVIGSIFGGGKAGGGPVYPGNVYEVGESGKELFSPQTAGTIVPNSTLRSMSGGGGGPMVVQLVVNEGAMFEPRVQAISGEVSIQTVRSAAPALMEGARQNTVKELQRPRL